MRAKRETEKSVRLGKLPGYKRETWCVGVKKGGGKQITMKPPSGLESQCQAGQLRKEGDSCWQRRKRGKIRRRLGVRVGRVGRAL